MEPRDETAYGSFILAPLSVIGVGGVVVIAILLVRNRRAPNRIRSRARSAPRRRKPSAPDAHPPDSSSNLRVLFASAGVHPGHPYSTLPGGMDAAVAPSESATTVTVADFAGDVEAIARRSRRRIRGGARRRSRGGGRTAPNAPRRMPRAPCTSPSSTPDARGGYDDDAERNAVARDETSKNDVARDETSKNEVAADDPGASSAFARENLARTAAAAMLSARRGMEGEDERAKTRRSRSARADSVQRGDEPGRRRASTHDRVAGGDGDGRGDERARESVRGAAEATSRRRHRRRGRGEERRGARSTRRGRRAAGTSAGRTSARRAFHHEVFVKDHGVRERRFRAMRWVSGASSATRDWVSEVLVPTRRDWYRKYLRAARVRRRFFAFGSLRVIRRNPSSRSGVSLRVVSARGVS